MLENIRLSLGHSFPNSEITLHEEQSILKVQLIGHDEHLSKADIHKAVCKVLVDSGAFSQYSAATITPYKSQEYFISTVATEIIRAAIATTINSVVEIELSVENRTIYTTLRSNGFYSNSNRETVKSKVQEKFQKSSLAQKYNIAITTHTYPATFNLSPPHDNDDSDDSYDDLDDSANPNWPSTTGNPSGGGRGNNI